jgi:hypothetical protein
VSERQVGIYWVYQGRVLAFSEPLSAVRAIDGVRDSDLGHDAIWSRVQASRPELRSREYFDVPRGRVLYRESEARFDVFMPKRFWKDRRVTAAVRRAFGLKASEVRLCADEHYEPFVGDIDVGDE